MWTEIGKIKMLKWRWIRTLVYCNSGVAEQFFDWEHITTCHNQMPPNFCFRSTALKCTNNINDSCLNRWRRFFASLGRLFWWPFLWWAGCFSAVTRPTHRHSVTWRRCTIQRRVSALQTVIATSTKNHRTVTRSQLLCICIETRGIW